MNKTEFLECFADNITDEFVVSPLGFTSQEWYAMKDRPRNFYILGSMGMPIPFGLGLSIAMKNDVLVLEGDASCLMNMGALSTVGSKLPDNLKIIIVDNESYDSTGGQPSATTNRTSIENVAIACGIDSRISTSIGNLIENLNWLKLRGTKLLVAKVSKSTKKAPLIDLLPEYIKIRFQKELILNPS